MTTVDQILTERKSSHGNFTDHARITQNLKRVIDEELIGRMLRQQAPLSYTQKEAVDMILHKIGRVIAGDASFDDHWIDIEGYAKIANGEK